MNTNQLIELVVALIVIAVLVVVVVTVLPLVGLPAPWGHLLAIVLAAVAIVYALRLLKR